MRKLVALCLVASGCAQEAGSWSPAQAPAELVVANGENLNGENLNGENLNGENLNGPGLGANVEYVSFAGASLGDHAFDSVWLEGTELHGTANRQELSGRDFDGAHFKATKLDGSPVELRIRDVAQKSRPNDDVWTYLVDFRNPQGKWKPLCRDASGSAVGAIPIGGRWNYGRGVPGGGDKIDDPGAFTFACEGAGAIAKCAFPIGYKPWKMQDGASLAPFHQACVRLIRADYCGDGTPWTKNGRSIDLYDGMGIQSSSRPFWLFEAEWDDSGALCVSTHRAIELRKILGTLPICLVGKISLTCGARRHFSSGTLLMNRYAFPYIGL